MKAVIFDLDGTLTYTLQDLWLSTNYALSQMFFPTRTIDEVRRFVGNGVRRLMEQAVPDGIDAQQFEQCFEHFRRHYVAHCQDHTCLYDGIAQLLRQLKEQGVPMAIVSNKLQAGVDELYVRYFRDTIAFAIGEQPSLQRKPAPDMVHAALHRLGVSAAEAVYVGDSEVDLLTARNAGLPCISVLWGFRDRNQLLEAGARTLVSTPQELLHTLCPHLTVSE